MSASNDILLMGDYERYEEAKINASVSTLKPGMAAELNSSGELILLASTAKAVPNRIMLLPITGGGVKTTALTAGEQARYLIPEPGDLINLLCLSGETINIGTQVILNNAGKGIATAGTPAKTFGVCEEAGGTLAADTHLAVRVN